MHDDDELAFGQAGEQLLAPPVDHNRDPAAWARDKLGVHLWSRQRQILESVRDNPRTAVPSCHSSGKTHVAATAVCWWICAHPPGSAMVVTTAPTTAQVRGILWRYVNAFHGKGALPGRTNLAEWYIGRTLVGLGRKPSDYDPASFSGYHAPRLLVVIDEASGVAREVWDALSTLVAGGHGRILCIGNPDRGTGEFAEVCKPGSGWNVLPISAHDTPAWTGEDVPADVAAQLINPEWVADRAQRWGEDSALYRAKVLGKFPLAGSANAVIPHDTATACRYLDLPETTPIEAGIDVGAGGDLTVIYERRGPRAGRIEEFRDRDPMRTVGRLADTLEAWSIERAKVDVTGIGWGIYGRLRELSRRHSPDRTGTHNAEVIAVNFAQKPSPGNQDRFLNKRAELWWAGRERSRLQTWDLSTVSDDTIAELTCAEYEIVDSTGRIKIESKDRIRSRLGNSPDRADALLLAFHETDRGPITPPDPRRFAGTNITPRPGDWGTGIPKPNW